MKGLDPECNRGLKRTQGTETSKYLEERTSIETPLVVASERGSGLCLHDLHWNGLEKPAQTGDSPVQVRVIAGFE